MQSTQLIPKTWDLPQPIRKRVGDEVGRQRAMVHQGHLLLVLHEPPRPEETHRNGLFFWRSADGNWLPKPLRHGQSPVGELIQEYEKRLNTLDEEEENAFNAKDYLAVLTPLNPLVRSLRNLHTALQHARENLPEVRELIVLRDRAYAVLRRAELQQADGQNMLEFIMAQQAEEQAAASHRQARSAHRLNVIAALTFPLLTICSVLGSGLKTGLEGWDAVSAPAPLLSVVGLGVAMGMVLLGYVTRR